MKKKYLIQVIDILEEIISIIQVSNPNPLYSGRSIADDAICDIKNMSTKLQCNDATVIENLKLLFAPTNSLQDISIDNNWADEYLELAEKILK
ncbi:MAG: hypothetical protein Q8M40_02020 [Legionella sp.]|nr:hypothetical protein [Legionella sp.]